MTDVAKIAPGTHAIPGTPFRVQRGAQWPWEVNVFAGYDIVASTDMESIRATLNHLNQQEPAK